LAGACWRSGEHRPFSSLLSASKPLLAPPPLHGIPPPLKRDESDYVIQCEKVLFLTIIGRFVALLRISSLTPAAE